jgi:hypothetical protein
MTMQIRMSTIFEEFGTANPAHCHRFLKILKDCISLLDISTTVLTKATICAAEKYLRKVCDRTGETGKFDDLVGKLKTLGIKDNPFESEEWATPSNELLNKFTEDELKRSRDEFQNRGYTLTKIISIDSGNFKTPSYFFVSDDENRYFISISSVPNEQARKLRSNLYIGQEVAILPTQPEADELPASSDTQFLDFWCEWEKLENTYPIGSQIKGYVSATVDYGVLVTISDGNTGLLHVSNIAGLPIGSELTEIFEVGEEIDVILTSIDKNKHRLSFSHTL